MTNEFSGKLALVTGATGGIGRATAELLAERGARLVLAGRDGAQLSNVAAEIPGTTVLPLDLTSQGNWQSAFRDCVRQHGDIDILAHVAGIYPAALVADMSDEYLETIIAVNLTGTIKLCREVTRHMCQRGHGAIVNVSSLGAQKPPPGLSVYAATKSGMEAFSKALALEVAPHVRVNIVAPGPTMTDSVREMLQTDTTGAAETVMRDIPFKRLAEPREVAEAIAFMASDRASYITGAVLHVNGGALMA